MKNKKMLLFAGVLAAFLMLAVPFAVASVDSEDVDAASSDPVAMIGETPYDTLQDAITAADSGATIEILNDFSLAQMIEIKKNLTIDGNKHTYTYTGNQGRAIDVQVEGINLTIKNLDICFDQTCERGINYNSNGELTLDHVRIMGDTKVTYALSLPGSSDNAIVTITDSSFTGRIALNVWGAGATITARDSDFISKDPTEVENYSAVMLNNNGETSAEGTTITINGGLISATDYDGRPSTAISNATDTGKVVVSSTTVVNGSSRIVVAIHTYPGSDQFYSYYSIQDFVEWFNNEDNTETNGNLKLIADVVLTEDLIIKSGSEEIELAGNGHTLTISEGVTFSVQENASLELAGITVDNQGLMVIDGTITSQNGSEPIFNGDGMVTGDKAEDVPGLEDKVQVGTFIDWSDSSIVSDSNSILISNESTITTSVDVQLRDDADSLMAVLFPAGTEFKNNSAISINEEGIDNGLYDIVYDISFYGITLPSGSQISIRLPVYEAGTVSVYYIDDNGKPTLFDSFVSSDDEGTYVCFNTSHNSLYALTYDNSGSSSGGIVMPGMGAPEDASEGFSTADYATMAGIVIAVVMLIGLVCIVRRN